MTSSFLRCGMPAGLLAALFIPATLFGQGGWQREAERYGWRLSLEAGRVAAEQSGKPLMVVIRCIP